MKFAAGNEVLVGHSDPSSIACARFGAASSWERAHARRGDAVAPASSVPDHSLYALARLLASARPALAGRLLARWASAHAHAVLPSLFSATASCRSSPSSDLSTFWHNASELVLVGLNSHAADLLSLHPACARELDDDASDAEAYLLSALAQLARDEVYISENETSLHLQQRRREWLHAVHRLLDDSTALLVRSPEQTREGARSVLQKLAGYFDSDGDTGSFPFSGWLAAAISQCIGARDETDQGRMCTSEDVNALIESHGSDLGNGAFDELLQALVSMEPQRSLMAASTGGFSPWLPTSLVPVLCSFRADAMKTIMRPLPGLADATQDEVFHLDFASSLACCDGTADIALQQLAGSTDSRCPVHGARAAQSLSYRLAIRDEREADIVSKYRNAGHVAAWRQYVSEALASGGLSAAARACVLGEDTEALRGVSLEMRRQLVSASSALEAAHARQDELEAVVSACNALRVQRESVLPGLLHAARVSRRRGVMQAFIKAETQQEFNALAFEAAQVAQEAQSNGEQEMEMMLDERTGANVVQLFAAVQRATKLSTEQQHALRHALMRSHANNVLQNNQRVLNT